MSKFKVYTIILSLFLVCYMSCYYYQLSENNDVIRKHDDVKSIKMTDYNSLESTSLISTLFISSNNKVFKLIGIVHYKYYNDLVNIINVDEFMRLLVNKYIRYEMGTRIYNGEYISLVNIKRAVKDNMNYDCNHLCKVDTILISNIVYSHTLD